MGGTDGREYTEPRNLERLPTPASDAGAPRRECASRGSDDGFEEIALTRDHLVVLAFDASTTTLIAALDESLIGALFAHHRYRSERHVPASVPIADGYMLVVVDPIGRRSKPTHIAPPA